MKIHFTTISVSLPYGKKLVHFFFKEPNALLTDGGEPSRHKNMPTHISIMKMGLTKKTYDYNKKPQHAQDEEYHFSNASTRNNLKKKEKCKCKTKPTFSEKEMNSRSSWRWILICTSYVGKEPVSGGYSILPRSGSTT